MHLFGRQKCTLYIVSSATSYICWHLAIDLLSTRRYQDGRQVFCKLTTDSLQVDRHNLLFTDLLYKLFQQVATSATCYLETSSRGRIFIQVETEKRLTWIDRERKIKYTLSVLTKTIKDVCARVRNYNLFMSLLREDNI